MGSITFRSITPVFHLELTQNGTEFGHSGQYRDTTYSIRVKRYERGTPDFTELMECVGPYRGIEPLYLDLPATHGVIVDVSQALTDELELCSESQESRWVTQTALTSLRLHASKGVQYHRTYLKRFPPHPAGGQAISLPISNQHGIPHLGRPSILQKSQFEESVCTFQALLNRRWNNLVFRRVLNLALEYHRITFCLEAVEHSFLILMVAFEALFKKKQGFESKASDLISKLLSTRKSDRDRIYAEFSGKSKQTFYKIRGAVAHGDLTFDDQVLKARYRALYQYVTKALIRLTSIPVDMLHPDKSYYDELSRYINERFNRLPNS